MKSYHSYMKTIVILMITACCTTLNTYGQTTPADSSRDTVSAIIQQEIPVVPPQYPGGNSALHSFLTKNVKYAPLRAGDLIGKARLIMRFTVDKEGRTSNPEVLQIKRVRYDEYDQIYIDNDPHWAEDIDTEYCIKEATRLIDLLEFIPGQKGEEKVNCQMVLPLFVYFAAHNYD